MPKRIPASSSTSSIRLRTSFDLRDASVRGRPIHGQSYGHHGPTFGPISRREGAAMLLDDTLGDGESKSTSTAAATEERVEEPRQVLRSESRAAVHNRAF